jgi:hypothetical protein
MNMIPRPNGSAEDSTRDIEAPVSAIFHGRAGAGPARAAVCPARTDQPDCGTGGFKAVKKEVRRLLGSQDSNPD